MISTKEYEFYIEDPRSKPKFGELDLSWGKTEMFMWEFDGKVPHVHLKALDGSKECCICLYEPAYYGHKKEYRDRLTENDCKILDEFFRSIHPRGDTNIWMRCTSAWHYSLYGKYKHKEEFFDREHLQPSYINIKYDRYTRRG